MGSIQDIPLILMATLVLTISVFSGSLVLNEVQNATDNSMIDQDAIDSGQRALSVFNIGIVAVNVFFYLVSFILAYQVRSNPVFAVPAILLLAVNVFASMQIANVYGAFARTTVFKSIANNFPLVEVMYSNMASITMILGGTLILLLYGKTRNGREVTV